MKWFAFKVFWPYSKIRAFGYRVLLSDYGEWMLTILGKLRQPLRKMLKGL